MRRMILLLSLALAGGLVVPAAAEAGLKFCNKTENKIWVAVAYHSKDKSDWVSRGWWTVEAGQCQTAIAESLQGRYYYYYAEDDTGSWSGDFVFCTTDKKFEIEGAENCKTRGYDAEGFREVDVGEKIDKTIDLVSQ